MLTSFPQCNFPLEFPEILNTEYSQNLIRYHGLSLSGITKIIHCGILINIPYCLLKAPAFIITKHEHFKSSTCFDEIYDMSSYVTNC